MNRLLSSVASTEYHSVVTTDYKYFEVYVTS